MRGKRQQIFGIVSFPDIKLNQHAVYSYLQLFLDESENKMPSEAPNPRSDHWKLVWPKI